MISEANPLFHISKSKGPNNGDNPLNPNLPFFIVIKSAANDDNWKNFIDRVKKNTQELKERVKNDDSVIEQHHSNKVECLQNRKMLRQPPVSSNATHKSGLGDQTINQKNQNVITCFKIVRTCSSRSVPSVQRGCKYFKCSRCGKQFPFYACLEHHISTTHEIVTKKWKCALCPYTCARKFRLTRHKLKHANNEYKKPTVKCHGCGKEYLGRSGISQHRRRMPKGDMLGYKYCEVVNTSSNHEKLGSRLNFETLSDSANTDDLTFSAKKNASQLKTVDKRKNSVETGGAKKTSIAKTFAQKHPKFKCTYDSCSYTCKKRRRMVLHTYKIHTNREYKCRLANCGKYYTTENALYDHVKSSHPKRRFPCDLCPMSYDYKCVLNQHLARKHNDTSQPKFVCKLCNKQFVTSSALGLHKLTHTKSKPHKCLECGQTFSSRGGLKRHIHGVHLKEMRYSCRFCGATTPHVSLTKDHEAMCIMNKNNVALSFPDMQYSSESVSRI